MPRSKENAELKRVVRLSVPLVAPTEETFCEVSYLELLLNVTSKGSSSNQNSNDSFNTDEEEREELRQIVKKLEDKYAPSAMYKGKKCKKHRDRLDDLLDKSDGYDLEDDFIDDAQAYDEYIPASMTTKRGGFYINEEELELRYVSDEEAASNEPSDVEITNNKRRHYSSDEMKEEAEEDSPPKSKLPRSAIKLWKKQRSTPFRKKLQEEKYRKAKLMIKKNVSSVGFKKPKLPLQRSVVQKDAQILNSTDDEDDMPLSTIAANKSQENERTPLTNGSATPEISLPEGLSSVLLATINKFSKEVSLTAKNGNGVRSLSHNAQELLYEIENNTHNLEKSYKTTLLDYLCHHLGCTQPQIKDRIKRINRKFKPPSDLLKNLSPSLKVAIEELRLAVSKRIPQLKLKFEAEHLAAKEVNEKLKLEISENSTDVKKLKPLPRQSFDFDEDTTKAMQRVFNIKVMEMNIKDSELMIQLKSFFVEIATACWPPGWSAQPKCIKLLREFIENKRKQKELDSINATVASQVKTSAVNVQLKKSLLEKAESSLKKDKDDSEKKINQLSTSSNNRIAIDQSPVSINTFSPQTTPSSGILPLVDNSDVIMTSITQPSKITSSSKKVNVSNNSHQKSENVIIKRSEATKPSVTSKHSLPFFQDSIASNQPIPRSTTSFTAITSKMSPMASSNNYTKTIPQHGVEKRLAEHHPQSTYPPPQKRTIAQVGRSFERITPHNGADLSRCLVPTSPFFKTTQNITNTSPMSGIKKSPSSNEMDNHMPSISSFLNPICRSGYQPSQYIPHPRSRPNISPNNIPTNFSSFNFNQNMPNCSPKTAQNMRDSVVKCAQKDGIDPTSLTNEQLQELYKMYKSPNFYLK